MSIPPVLPFALRGQEPVHAALVGFVHVCGLAQRPLPLARLLGEDVAQERLLALDLPVRRLLEALRGAAVCLHLRHAVPPGCWAPALYFRVLGARIRNMLRPSSRACCSTTAISPISSTTSSSTSLPFSVWAISRPRNMIVTLTLSRSERKRLMWRVLNSKSCSSMFGRILISFI